MKTFELGKWYLTLDIKVGDTIIVNKEKDLKYIIISINKDTGRYYI